MEWMFKVKVAIAFEELVYLTALACVARLGVGLWLTKHMIF